jgi:hypothetical protein
MTALNRPLVIGLSGKSEHGKSAASRVIVEASQFLGLGARVVEISAIIRLSAVSRGLLPPDVKREEMNYEQIKVLVDEGSWGRAQDPDYWTKQVHSMIEASPDLDVAIIPNIRFPQEVTGCDYVVRLNRLNYDRSPFISTTRDPNDITETALDHCRADFYITNVTGHARLFEMNVTTLFAYIWEDLWEPRRK